MPEKQEFFPFPDSPKLFLAFFRKVYYTIKAPCRCDEMVDVADSKCASSILTPGEKVVAVASLFVYNKIR